MNWCNLKARGMALRVFTWLPPRIAASLPWLHQEVHCASVANRLAASFSVMGFARPGAIGRQLNAQGEFDPMASGSSPKTSKSTMNSALSTARTSAALDGLYILAGLVTR